MRRSWHSCGYKLANDGQDTRAIQHYLGHKSINSTVRYTALAPDRLPVGEQNGRGVPMPPSIVAGGLHQLFGFLLGKILTIASGFDEGLRIVEMKQPSGKTAPKWRGAEGRQLLKEVESLQEEDSSRSERWCLDYIKTEMPHRYPNISLNELAKRFTEAKRHHAPKR
jgi:hypothetical protein